MNPALEGIRRRDDGPMVVPNPPLIPAPLHSGRIHAGTYDTFNTGHREQKASRIQPHNISRTRS